MKVRYIMDEFQRLTIKKESGKTKLRSSRQTIRQGLKRQLAAAGDFDG